MAEDKKQPVSADEAQKPGAQEPMPKSGPTGGKLLAMLLGVTVVAVFIAIAGYEFFSARHQTEQTTTTSTGVPSVGGPFELVNHKGETVTDKDFLGRHMLVFFGYTYCPDVCPTALSDMSTAMDILGAEKSAKVTPVFVSVDPARDTPEHLSEYVSYFHPNTVGLTGTEEQVKAVAREYRVYFRKNEPHEDDPQDYLVDHTAIVYLMGPDGNLVTHFSHGTTPEAMAERLGQFL